MKKIILLFIIASTTLTTLQAQQTSKDYVTAVGVKFFPGALTVKHFLNDNNAIEGLGYFWQYGSRITGLYEHHTNFNTVDGLKWYVGAGAHIGFWNDKWKNNYPSRNSGVAMGIDGVLGLDYKLKTAPLNFSIDWQPSFNFIGYNYFEGGWGGLAVRYTF